MPFAPGPIIARVYQPTQIALGMLPQTPARPRQRWEVAIAAVVFAMVLTALVAVTRILA